MNQESPAQVRPQAALPCRQGRRWVAIFPGKVWILLLLFFVVAVLMGVHTILTAKDSSLHLKLQHGFRSAQVSVWVDRELAYSGKVYGSVKKRFGLIPTDSVQGSLSEVIPVRSGQIRFACASNPMAQRCRKTLLVAASPLTRKVTSRCPPDKVHFCRLGSAEGSTSFAWFSRYAGSLVLTIAGSIMSALTGYAIRELPGRLRSTSQPASRGNLRPQ